MSPLSYEAVREVNDLVYGTLGAVVGAPALGTALAGWANNRDHVDWDAAIHDVSFASLGWLSGTTVALRGASLTWRGLTAVFAAGALGGRVLDGLREAGHTNNVAQVIEHSLDPLAAMRDGGSMVLAHVSGLAVAALGKRAVGAIVGSTEPATHMPIAHGPKPSSTTRANTPPTPTPTRPIAQPPLAERPPFQMGPTAEPLQAIHEIRPKAPDWLDEPISLSLDDAVAHVRRRIESLQREALRLDKFAGRASPLGCELEKAQDLADAADAAFVDPVLESDAFGSAVGKIARLNLQKELAAVRATIKQKLGPMIQRQAGDAAASPLRQTLAGALREVNDSALAVMRSGWSEKSFELDTRRALLEGVLRAHSHEGNRGKAAQVQRQLQKQLAAIELKERLPHNTHYLDELLNAIERLPEQARNAPVAREAMGLLSDWRDRLTAISRELLDDGEHTRLAAAWHWEGSKRIPSDMQSELAEMTTRLQLLDEALSSELGQPQAMVAARPMSN